MKVIFAVVKQLKQLQRKPRNSKASTGFEPMTSANLPMLYQLSYEAVFESEFSLYPLYEGINYKSVKHLGGDDDGMMMTTTTTMVVVVVVVVVMTIKPIITF